MQGACGVPERRRRGRIRTLRGRLGHAADVGTPLRTRTAAPRTPGGGGKGGTWFEPRSGGRFGAAVPPRCLTCAPWGAAHEGRTPTGREGRTEAGRSGRGRRASRSGRSGRRSSRVDQTLLRQGQQAAAVPRPKERGRGGEERSRDATGWEAGPVGSHGEASAAAVREPMCEVCAVGSEQARERAATLVAARDGARRGGGA